MWQRLTERARKAVFCAQEVAGRSGINEVTSSHLLLGLLAENEDELADTEAAGAVSETWPPPPRMWSERDSIAIRVLKELGVNLNLLSTSLQKPMPTSPDVAPDVHDMRLSPASKRAIDLAYDEAQLMKNKYVGTEHLLLGLIREEKSQAGQVLIEQLGVTRECARQEIRRLLGHDGKAPRPMRSFRLWRGP